MRNIFITTYDGEWKGPAEVLRDRLGYEILELHGKEYGNFPTKGELLQKELGNSRNLFRNRRKIDGAGTVICSNYCALVLLLMKKLHLISFERLLWFGVYVHRPKMIEVCRRLIHFALPKEELAAAGKDVRFKVVVFSRPEVELYEKGFALNKDHFLYVPYGEWNPDKKLEDGGDEGYFFSGGYANRDFVALAQLFQNRPWKLVIAASKANTDFVSYCESHELSDNIMVYWDIPAAQFNRLLRFSHAVMLVMKYNTGASGQVVLLTALEHEKLIIASYTDVVDEYVQNERTGLILQDKSPEALETVMERVNDPAEKEHMLQLARAGRQHYENTFSYQAIADYLVREVQQN
jgi:glycosyltransferase involved in cell wall biosynthesis